MKLSKKIISVILSLTMIMSAISVCFVTLAAGTDDADADQWNALVEALSKEYVSKGKFTVSGTTATFTDNANGDFQAAFDAYKDVFNAVAETGSDASEAQKNSKFRTSTMVNNEIKTKLQSEMGDKFTSKIGSVVGAFNADQKINANSSTSKAYAAVTVTVKIVKVPADAIKSAATIDEASAATTATVATLTNADASYSVTNCNTTTTTHYLRTTKITSGADVTATTDLSALKALETAVNANSAYFSYSLPQMIALDTSVAGDAYNALNNAYNDAKTMFTDDIIAHFFDAAAIEATIKNFVDANSIKAEIIPVCEEIAAKLAEDFSEYDTEALGALYNDIATRYDTFKAADKAVRDYLIESNYIDTAAVEAKLVEINDAKEVLELTAMIPVLEEKYAAGETFKDNTADELLDGDVDVDALTLAVSDMQGLIKALGSYADKNKAAVLDLDFIADFEALADTIDALLKADTYDKEFAKKYQEYVAEVYAAVDLDEDSEDLFDAIKGIDDWYTELNSMIDFITERHGAEVADRIFGELDDQMKAHIDAKYAILNARNAAQVDVAYEVYKTTVEFYGDKVTLATLGSLTELEAAFGELDMDLLVFIEETPNFDMDAETAKKVADIRAIFEDYEAFVSSNGFDRYQKSTMGDIIRYVSDRDVARDKDFAVTDETAEELIALLNKVLGSTEIKDLGVDLNGLIGQIPSMLYSDEMLNKIVSMLFPMVSDLLIEMLTTMIPPSVHIAPDTEGIPDIVRDKDVTIKLPPLLDIAKNAGLYFFPVQLADSVRAEGFTAAAAALAAAKTTPLFTAKKASGKVTEKTLEDGSTIKVDAQGNTLDGNGVYVLDENGDYVDAKLDNPWYDASLYRTVVDEEGNAVLDEEGKEVKEFYLEWGIEGKEDFVNALSSVIGFLEPVLASVLGNKFVKLQRNLSTTKETIVIDNVFLSFDFNINTLHAVLKVGDAETGEGANLYNNVLVPIFEILGLREGDFADGKTFRPTNKGGLGIASDDYQTTKNMLNAILTPVEKILDNLAADPVGFIIEVLPNIVYALESGALKNFIDAINLTLDLKLGTPADQKGAVDASGIGLNSLWGLLKVDPKDLYEAFGLDMFIDNFTSPIVLNVAELVDFDNLAINGTKLDLSGINGLLGLVSGLLGVELPAMNGAKLATLGDLVAIDTGRDKKTYTWGEDGKAAYIEADKTDVIVFILDYLFSALQDENFIPAIIEAINSKDDAETEEGEETETPAEEAAPFELPEIVKEIIANIVANENDAIAAIAELLFPVEYDMPGGIQWKETVDREAYEKITDAEGKEQYLVVNQNVQYSELWTEEKAVYVAENLPTFIENICTLFGIEVNGEKVTDLDKTIVDLVTGFFTAENANKLLDTIKGLTEGIEVPEALTGILTDVAGLDLTYWNNIEAYAFEDGDEAAFKAALVEMLKPLTKVLAFVLADEDIAIQLTDEEGKFNVVTLQGYDGYSDGLIPVLEVLGAENVLTPAAFFADQDNMVENIVTMLFSAVDKILADPFNEVIDLLPNVLYFLASDGLTTAIDNLLFSVNVALDTIRPIYDVNLVELLNFDIRFVEFDPIAALFTEVSSMISKATGFDFDINFNTESLLSQIPINERVAYTSANGKTAYKLEMSELATADLITVILRFVLGEFVFSENAENYAQLAKEKLDLSDEQFTILYTILYTMRYLHDDHPDYVMGILFWVFYGADTAVDAVADFYKNANNSMVDILAKIADIKTEASDKAAYIMADIYAKVFGAIGNGQVVEILNSVKERVGAITDEIDATINGIPAQVDETLAGILAEIKVKVEEANKKVDETLGGITDKIDDTLGEITDKVEDGVGEIGDKLDGVADEISGVNDQMNGIFARILEMFRKLVDMIKSLFRF